MTEKNWRMQLVIVHPLISVLVPSLFVLTLHALARGSLGLPVGFPDALALLFPLACVLEAAAGNASRANRAPPYARLREITLFLLASTAVLVLLRVPLQHLAYLIFMILLSWGLSYAIHGWLRSREVLLRSTEGKTGRELDRALHQSMLLEGDALILVTRVRRTATALVGANVAIASLLVLTGIRVRVVATLFLLAQALARLGVSTALNSMAMDQRLLAQGLRLSPAQRTRRLTLAVLELGSAALISLAASRPRPLVRISTVAALVGQVVEAVRSRRPFLWPWLRELLARIWTWLSGLLPRLRLGALAEGMPSLGVPGEPSELTRRVLYALGMTVLVLVVALVVAFLTAPLGEKDVVEGLERKRPLRFLVRRARLLAALVARLARGVRATLAQMLREGRRAAPSGSGGAGAGATARVGDAPRGWRSRARERRLRTLRQRTRRAYATLCAWAREAGLHPAPGAAPLELAALAGRAAGERAPQLFTAAELVERVLYGPGPPVAAAVGELERLVRSVVRERVRVAGGRT